MTIFIKFFVMSILLMFTSPADTASGYVAENISQAQFTTRVKTRVPVDEIDEISNQFKSITFFTDIRDCKNCKVKHQWYHRGNLVNTVETTPKYNRWRWWSNKSLTDDVLGDWTVKVLINGKVVLSRTISYYVPTVMQVQQVPVQHRMRLQETDECEMQLRYFSDKIKDEPDDGYFQFMMKKWTNRCLGN